MQAHDARNSPRDETFLGLFSRGDIIAQMNRKAIYWLGVLFLSMVLFACSPLQVVETGSVVTASPLQVTRAVFTPYWTPTATGTLLPTPPGTPTPFPTPTATPRTHVVERGEDMFGIALRYGLTLEELTAANPEVNPNLLSVGTALIIPASPETLPEDALPTPTPAAAVLGELACIRSAENGLWCWLPVLNEGASALESVSAVIRLADGDGAQVAERVALTPLNLVPAGGALPLLVYFPPPVPLPYQVNAVLQSAYPVPSSDDRYIPASIEELEIDIQEDGLSARVSGLVVIPQEVEQVDHVWVAAIAFDASERIAGVRRWEGTLSSPVQVEIPFTLFVYSVGDPITMIDVFLEVRR